THNLRSSAIWVGGPPNPLHPMRPHCTTTSRSEALGLSSAPPPVSSVIGGGYAPGERQLRPTLDIDVDVRKMVRSEQRILTRRSRGDRFRRALHLRARAPAPLRDLRRRQPPLREP